MEVVRSPLRNGLFALGRRASALGVPSVALCKHVPLILSLRLNAAFPQTGNWLLTSSRLISTNGPIKLAPGQMKGGTRRMSLPV